MHISLQWLPISKYIFRLFINNADPTLFLYDENWLSEKDLIKECGYSIPVFLLAQKRNKYRLLFGGLPIFK
jgi:hypothetical protein